MYCSKCGTKNDKAAKFCKNCGQPLATAQVTADKTERTQAAAAPTRTQPQSRDCLWFVGGLVLALIVGGIWLTVAL